MSRTISIIATALLVSAMPALAEVSSQTVTRDLPIYLGGTFVLENTAGDIDVVGTDEDKVILTATKIVRAPDKATLQEGKNDTQVALLGDPRIRVVRTLVPAMQYTNWTSSVNYVVRVPRTVHVKIVSSVTSKRIHIADIRGNVAVKSFDGMIIMDRVTGPSTVDTANGTIIFNAPGRAGADAQLTSVNGNIEVHAPADANFQWIAATIKGDVRTTFPVRAIFDGTKFHGSINAPGGPTITTRSLMGNVAVLKNGTLLNGSRSLRGGEVVERGASGPARPSPNMVGFQRNVVDGLSFSTLMGPIAIGQVRGNAKLATGAGEVQVGSVLGDCEVTSLGGPLNLGEIQGALNARTEAGDVLVQSAQNGGSVTTGGGIIRLLYTGGPTRLQSGGGDIVVKQAAGPINAETQSGDISITIDPTSDKEKITAKTAKGNILIEAPATFAADIEATVITSQPDVKKFISDFPGLSVRREQIAGKTKIRASGKINGGGERLELYAQDGSIQISIHSKPSVTVIKP